ncbi:MAG: redoxin domain-containing protein [Elusimicrobiota bacterium]
MSRTPLRRVASVMLLLAAAPVCRAARPLTPPAPEFTEGAAWVNSAPFTLERLRGRRVVVVSFMNAFTLNSIRTFERLQRWWDRYALDGLMVIGAHTPDYDFDRDPLQVRKAVKRFGITFPVLIDSGRLLWSAYANEGWPAHYLIDHKGRIIHDRLGEGHYAEFEREILTALNDLNGYRPPEAYRIPKDPARADCGEFTRPLYLGVRRKVKILEIRPKKIEPLVRARDGEVATRGLWSSEAEALRYNGNPEKFRDGLRIVYRGAEAVTVASRFGPRPVRLYVRQDNLWLHNGNANADVRWDEKDRSYVLVDEPRLYYLIKNAKKGRLHELMLYPTKKGIAISSFEFSDHCETAYKHR